MRNNWQLTRTIFFKDTWIITYGIYCETNFYIIRMWKWQYLYISLSFTQNGIVLVIFLALYVNTIVQSKIYNPLFQCPSTLNWIYTKYFFLKIAFHIYYNEYPYVVPYRKKMSDLAKTKRPSTNVTFGSRITVCFEN